MYRNAMNSPGRNNNPSEGVSTHRGRRTDAAGVASLGASLGQPGFVSGTWRSPPWVVLLPASRVVDSEMVLGWHSGRGF